MSFAIFVVNKLGYIEFSPLINGVPDETSNLPNQIADFPYDINIFSNEINEIKLSRNPKITGLSESSLIAEINIVREAFCGLNSQPQCLVFDEWNSQVLKP